MDDPCPDVPYLVTPYYHTRNNYAGEKSDVAILAGEDNFPHLNYRPYNLFVLRTRLEPILRKRLPYPVMINFDTYRLDHKLTVIIELRRKGQIVDIETHHRKYLQDMINKITADEPQFCLLLGEDSQWVINDGLTNDSQSLIPASWVKELMPFLSFNPYLRAFYRNAIDGQASGIYLDLSRVDAYASFYRVLYQGTIRRLEEMYVKGFLAVPSSINTALLEKWGLVRVSEDNLDDLSQVRKYLVWPHWQDKRLTDPVGGMVPFSQRHLWQNRNSMLLEVGENLYDRHRVSKYLAMYRPDLEFRFCGSQVRVAISNLADAWQVAALVDSSRNGKVGRIGVLSFPNRSMYNLYLTYAYTMTTEDKNNNGLDESDIRGYKTDDETRPYWISIEMPFYANSQYYVTQFKKYVWTNIAQEAGQIAEIVPTISKISVPIPSLVPQFKPALKPIIPAVALPGVEPHALYRARQLVQAPIAA